MAVEAARELPRRRRSRAYRLGGPRLHHPDLCRPIERRPGSVSAGAARAMRHARFRVDAQERNRRADRRARASGRRGRWAGHGSGPPARPSRQPPGSRIWPWRGMRARWSWSRPHRGTSSRMSPLACDFVDQYRETGDVFDYALEERWVRDEGYLAVPAERNPAGARARCSHAGARHAFHRSHRGARLAVDRSGRGPAGGERRRGPVRRLRRHGRAASAAVACASVSSGRRLMTSSC